MGIIRSGTMKIRGKKVRAQVHGYERDKKFIACETWINETDLINIGLLEYSDEDWEDSH